MYIYSLVFREDHWRLDTISFRRFIDVENRLEKQKVIKDTEILCVRPLGIVSKKK